MKKGIGCLVLIIALVMLSVIGGNTGHYGGGGGFITFIIFTLVFIGWKLISSKNTTSSDDKSPNISKSQTDNINGTFDNNIVGKAEKKSSFHQSSIKPKQSTNTKSIINSHTDDSESSEIKQIERQYTKGVFSKTEKDELISKIKFKKDNDELNEIIDSLQNKLIHEYNNDCKDLKELNKSGLIDKGVLNNKLTVLKSHFEDKMKNVKTQALVEHSKRLYNNKKI